MNKENVITAQGGFGRSIAVRLKPGTDVLLGLREACVRHGIKNGVIVSALGSLATVSICNPVEMPDTKAGYGYGSPEVYHQCWELLCASGVICHDEDGEINLHVHVAMSDPDGNAIGGHLAEGTKVLITVDAVIAELDGIEMERKYDDSVGFPILSPRTK